MNSWTLADSSGCGSSAPKRKSSVFREFQVTIRRHWEAEGRGTASHLASIPRDVFVARRNPNAGSKHKTPSRSLWVEETAAKKLQVCSRDPLMQLC
jgi:hypothetical protein